MKQSWLIVTGMVFLCAGLARSENPAAVACPSPESSVWTQGEYLLWFLSGQPLPQALVTQGLGVPGTADGRVLFGGQAVDMGLFSGGRFGLGMWIDHEHQWGLEGSGFFLAANTARFDAQSDANGVPSLGQPVSIPGLGEQSYIIAAPGLVYGRFYAEQETRLYGWEANVVRNLVREDGWQVDALVGYRQLRFTENLTMKTNMISLAPGMLSFLGQPLPSGASQSIVDYFGAGNDIYAPQIGARLSCNVDRLGCDLFAKVGLGVAQQKVDILGGSTYTAPFPGMDNGAASGGVYAQQTNSPGGSATRFVVVPEVNARVSYEVFPSVRLSLGYGFLYVSEVARPGNQIDRVINPNNVPSDQDYGRYVGPDRPAFLMQRSSLWAHGVNIGAEIKF
ncbi:MAG: BBP7 family outer membrane beta-barrel protein [Gemmataceae bacterium]